MVTVFFFTSGSRHSRCGRDWGSDVCSSDRWCGFGVLVMLMQPFVRSRHFFTFLALIGALVGTAASVTAAMHAGPGFGGLVQSDSFSFFFRLLVGTVRSEEHTSELQSRLPLV